VRYWRKCSRQTEMGIQSEDVMRSARFKPWLPLEVWFCLTAKTMLRGVQHCEFGTTVSSQTSVSVWSIIVWCLSASLFDVCLHHCLMSCQHHCSVPVNIEFPPGHWLMSGRAFFGVSKHHRPMFSKRRVSSQSSVSVWLKVYPLTCCP